MAEIDTTFLLKRVSDELGEVHLQRIIQQCRAEQAEAERDALKKELLRLKGETDNDHPD